MDIKSAIEKAIEGGWNEGAFFPLYKTTEDSRDGRKIPLECVFLDPRFWFCLGKSMGWDKLGLNEIWLGRWGKIRKPEWEYQMLLFTYLLAEGGSIESYFEQLK